MPKHQFKIIISNLKFLTIVGILDAERLTEQMVIADMEIIYNKEEKKFINYAEVAQLIEETMQKEKFLLLEEALACIVDKLKVLFPSIVSIQFKLLKPDILDNCVVGVEIFKNY